MGTQYLPSLSPLHHKSQIYVKIRSSWEEQIGRRKHQRSNTIINFKYRIISYRFPLCRSEKQDALFGRNKIYARKTSKEFEQLSTNPASIEKKGTVAGAVALIIGTSIGSGILALPQKTSPAGFLPSSLCIITCWGFLLVEAFLLVEINVGLLRRKRSRDKETELEVISIRTMAQETLGEWGGLLATVTNVFLGYSSMVAYSSKSGEILYHLINIPASLSGCFFTFIFAILIALGGTRATDQVNQWLTASMIGLLVAIEVLALLFGGWSGFGGNGDWGKVPSTIPVVIFSLVYHDLAPVLCAYLEGDIRRIRASVLLGSLVPLLAFLIWNAIALGLSQQVDQIADPVESLMRVKWSGVPFMVETFSLLAVGTSLIGTVLSFSQFFMEQLRNFSWSSPSTELIENPNKLVRIRQWCRRNRTEFTAIAMVVAPTLVVSTNFPDAFTAATDIAGGYCMTVLYGVIPPAMAWAMQEKECDFDDQKGLLKAWPALVGVEIFACGIVIEQILQDFSIFRP